jgi:thiamine pyrophosphate-dependent acetolactate synthase large subunit-like protein
MEEMDNDHGLSEVSRRQFVKSVAGMAVTGPVVTSDLGTTVPDPRAPRSNAADEKPRVARVMEGTAGALLVEQLRAAGVEFFFHSNTSGVDTLLDALVDMTDLHLIELTHEAQGVSVAEGYALASRKLPFFLASEAGIGNTITNLYNASKDRVPMVISFVRMPLKDQGGQDALQEWDGHLDSTRPFTQWSWSCVEAETMPEMLRRSMQFAVCPPGGPVSIDFPIDLLRKKIRAPIYELDPMVNRPVFRASKEQVETAAQWLAEAQNPMFLVGMEVGRSGTTKSIQELAEKLGIPVYNAGYLVASQDLYCNFPTRHALFADAYMAHVRFPDNPDLLINFGARFDPSYPPPAGARIIHITGDANALHKVFPTDLGIAGDLTLTIPELSSAVDGILSGARLKQIRESRLPKVTSFTQGMRQSREIALRARFDQSPLSLERVGYELEKALDKDAVIVPELGTEGASLIGQLSCGGEDKARYGRTIGGALGWGLGAAFGVSLALPDRQVVALSGDGGFMFGQSDALWTISRYDAPMLIIIANNHSYNETRNRNMASGGREFQASKDMSSYLGNPDVDFTRIAEAYSIRAQKVREPSELAPAIQTGLKTLRDGRPFLLDVEIGRDGILSESTWFPAYSIAGQRNKNAKRLTGKM